MIAFVFESTRLVLFYVFLLQPIVTQNMEFVFTGKWNFASFSEKTYFTFLSLLTWYIVLT